MAAYLVCNTQWRYGGMGARTGLDYAACFATLDRYLPRWKADEGDGPSVWGALTVDDLMQDIQIIESALLAVDQEKRERESDPRTQGNS